MRILPLLSMSLLLGDAVARAAAPPSALAECYAGSANRIVVGQCLERRFDEVSAELATAVSAVRERMLKLDAATGRKLATGTFDRSQQAFVDFREDNCVWLATQVGAGTGSGDLERDCQIRMTRARTDELRSLGQATPSDAAPKSSAESGGPALAGQAWRLTRLLRNGQKVGLVPGSAPSIQFDEAGHVSGNASVNRFSGGYAVDASGSLRWSQSGFATTRMSGAPDLMRQEDWVLDALNRAVRVQVAGNTLMLRNDDESIVLTFER
jgi:heat shock protein HslJ